MKKIVALVLFSFLLANTLKSQDTNTYKLRLWAPLLDMPQNANLPYTYPSMQQALQYGNDVYELGYWGINALGNSIFKPGKSGAGKGRKIAAGAFNYILGFAFANYGSELPIPMGVWAHEEFHRAVLGVNGIASKNGNWLGSRWDGTVYGPTDEQLDAFKKGNPSGLLYAYVAGVQAENMFTYKNVTEDFFNRRTQYKNPLYLYNAYYVWNYFSFSTGSISDSVKVLAPPHESKTATERDFAGADLTAWAYDMFNPAKPFTSRDSFPGGNGVNRRVGFSDLPADAQDFLKKQKTLSLINFINPAIFLVNRIKINDNFSFNFFAQYAPTQFGNDVSLTVPFSLRQRNFLVGLHNYNNRDKHFFGVDIGTYMLRPLSNKKLSFSGTLSAWMQPENQSYYDTQSKAGGAIDLSAYYPLGKGFTGFAGITAKTKGWVQGNPYLDNNLSARLGFGYLLVKNK